MLDWMFKKKPEAPKTPAAPKPNPNAAAAAEAARAADAARSARKKEAAEASRAAASAAVSEWQARLTAAGSDDAALLEIARLAPSIDVKCAAVEALTDEAALKEAERAFRTHDRRVHRVAKQRHDAAVAQRVAREHATRLIQSAAALLNESTIPTNRLVELDRAWQALDAPLLDEAQKQHYAELSARLTELTRERGERALQIQRWTSSAQQALLNLKSMASSVAAGTAERAELAAASGAAQTLRQTVPEADEAAAMGTRLGDALTLAERVEARLCLLDSWAQAAPQRHVPLPASEDEPAAPPIQAQDTSTANTEAQRSPASPVEDPPAAVPTPSPSERWAALPPLADAQIAAALNQRFEQWRVSVAPAAKAGPSERTQQRKAAKAAAKEERGQAVAPLLQQAEAALEAGNLAETHAHLLAIDELIGSGAAPEALRARLTAVHAEYSRLKGWQHWGGGRARDDLVQEAQTLATATAAAVADPAQAAKLPVKQLADAIDDLRKRWKELDRLGGATSQSLWHGFDAALKAAFEPVGAHLDVLKARRKENLVARQGLIDVLDAVSVSTDTPTDSPVDLKEPARALAHFHTEWRKLGPVEHTVPHKARDKLIERMLASVARVEVPLHEARRAAQQEREQLVARAKVLSAEATASPHSRDIIPRVRELQEAWQHHARMLPLTRQVENALWAEFKAATDAVFAQRDAAYVARDAELNANLAIRESLLARLEALTPQTPAPEIKRVLADVDAAWRTAGEVPRNQAVALDARLQAAHQAALRSLADGAQQSWHLRCDALDAKLALCEALEKTVAAGADAAAIEVLAHQWAELAPLQAAWEQPLALRWQRGLDSARSAAASGSAAPGLDDGALDAVLLQFEAALNLASPPEHQAARRDMKLRAMKAALEGKPVSARRQPASAGVGELTAAALSHAHPNEAQAARLRSILAALRAAGPNGAPRS